MTEKFIQFGEFTLNSGLKSDFKLIADQFILAHKDELARLIRRTCGPFSHVKGIPRGGLVLEEVLMGMADRSLRSTLLIVDDVLTTGGSFRRFRERLSESYDHIMGVAVFARGPCPDWVKSVFQMPWELWMKECR